MKDIIILFIFSILFSNNVLNSLVVFPFKTYTSDSSSDNVAYNFLKTNLNNTIYIELEIGTPSQKIPTKILSDEYGFFIFNKKCIIPSSFKTIEQSNTYMEKKIVDYLYKFKTQNDMTYGNDIIKLPMMNDNKKYMTQITIDIMYSPNKQNNNYSNKNENCFSDNENHDYTCASLGIKGSKSYANNFEINFISQLYEKQIIDNQYFSVQFLSDTEGMFIIGGEPHEVNPKKYTESKIRRINSIENNFLIFWQIHPDKIYFSKNNEFFNMTTNLICTLEYNLGIIYGTEIYYNMISNSFFNDYINKGDCHKELINNKYTIFYCDNKKIITRFPSLFLYVKQFLYSFELTYEDLFIEKKNKFFFLIIFDSSNNNQWKLGKPFLKKYTLVYNYNDKTIGFYNENILSSKNRSSFMFYFFIGVLTIIFGGLGFILGKKVYEKVRKKRINELEDEYNYKMSKDINGGGIGNNKPNLEMKIKFKGLFDK